MIRAVLFTTALTAMLPAPAATTVRAIAPIASPAAPQVSAADAAPFLGDWTLTLQGPNGPGVFDLSVRVEKEAKEKVVGEISNPQLPKQAIRDISLVEKSLILGYAFSWENSPVEAVVSLTPAADGKMTAQIDFAGGAYVMSGTATRKETK